MKGRKPFSSLVMAFLIIVAMITLMSGCDNQSPGIVSPDKTGVAEQGASLVNDSYLSSIGGSLVKAGSRWIGPWGGTVQVGRHFLCIPRYALDRRVKIRMSVSNGRRLVVHLGPDGLEFNRSATLTLSYARTNYNDLVESDFQIVCLDDGSFIPTTVDTESLTVSGPIDHFSRYAVSKGCR